jgi:hypothetical protein
MTCFHYHLRGWVTIIFGAERRCWICASRPAGNINISWFQKKQFRYVNDPIPVSSKEIQKA